jgi:peptidoglycan/LPS O-acetylase OafA/YrhL
MTDPGLFVRVALLLHDYAPQTLFTGIGPAWSLCVEVIFYLAVPVLGLLAARLAADREAPGARTAAALAPVALLLGIGVSGKLASWWLGSGTPSAGWTPTWHAVVERSFWGQADLFAFGMLLAVVWVRVQDGTLRLARRWQGGAVVLATIVLVPCLRTLGDGQLTYLPQNTLVAFAFALLLAVVVLRPAGTPARALDSRPLYLVGLVSYSVFLWHVPLIEWLAAHGWLRPGLDGLFVNLIVVAGLTLALSALTYLAVERPALRRKRSARLPEPAASAPGVTVGV